MGLLLQETRERKTTGEHIIRLQRKGYGEGDARRINSGRASQEEVPGREGLKTGIKFIITDSTD